MIQAYQGDCFILEYGTEKNPHYILIDGGPADNYFDHLRGYLKNIADNNGILDLIINSHIDNDHIEGLVDFLSELAGKEKFIQINQLWFNSFGKQLNIEEVLEDRIRTVIVKLRNLQPPNSFAGKTYLGIDEGGQFIGLAERLNLKPNKSFKENLISVDSANDFYEFNNIKIYVIGPTEKYLKKLKKDWGEWMKEYEEKIMSEKITLDEARETDYTVPNLSSIMILVEKNDKRILLTGDGRGRDIIEGLEKRGLLKKNDVFHVDILKLPHHGSYRNITRNFFRKITANKYVISAKDYRNIKNPDFDTLKWIIEAGKEQNRRTTIYVTNMTSEIKKFLKKYNEEEHNYEIIPFDEGEISRIFKLY